MERVLMRPDTGMGHYLRDVVYGCLDGCITTFAVVAGVAGAHLSPFVALALGLANLLADGIAMGAGNYLGLKSELEQNGGSVAQEMPWRHGAATFAAFVVAGSVPLAAYLIPWPDDTARLAAAGVVAAIVLAGIGAARARFITHRAPWKQGLEMLVIGGAAGAAAFGIGALVGAYGKAG